MINKQIEFKYNETIKSKKDYTNNISEQEFFKSKTSTKTKKSEADGDPLENKRYPSKVENENISNIKLLNNEPHSLNNSCVVVFKTNLNLMEKESKDIINNLEEVEYRGLTYKSTLKKDSKREHYISNLRSDLELKLDDSKDKVNMQTNSVASNSHHVNYVMKVSKLSEESLIQNINETHINNNLCTPTSKTNNKLSADSASSCKLIIDSTKKTNASPKYPTGEISFKNDKKNYFNISYVNNSPQHKENSQVLNF